MKHKIATILAGVMTFGVMSTGIAAAQEPIREPIIGLCLRPFVGRLLDLPLIDIFEEDIPAEPLEFSLGGQYRRCQ